MILLCFLVKSPHFRPGPGAGLWTFHPWVQSLLAKMLDVLPEGEDSCVISMVNEYQMKNGYYEHLLTMDITEDY